MRFGINDGQMSQSHKIVIMLALMMMIMIVANDYGVR